MLYSRIVLLSLVCLAVDAVGQRSARSPKMAARTVEPLKTYLTAVAQPGDDVAGLLTRYALFDYPCNVNQFFSINKLRVGSRIKAETTYKLPVEVVTYNGKSIRSTLNISDWKTAKRIEEYNKYALDEGLRPDNFVETKRLWVPWHALNCPPKDEPVATEASIAEPKTERPEKMIKTEKPVPAGLGEKPSSRGSRNFPILGDKYQYTPLISNRLRGKVFYLVSGHGGPDTGAQGRRSGRTLCEDEYAYDVTLRLLRLLLSHGATAYMIVRDPDDGIRDGEILNCDYDEYVWGDKVIPRDQKERLTQRSDLINAFTEQNNKAGLTDQTFVEIHVDSRTHDTKTDVFFYYRPEDNVSRKLALSIHQTFLQKYLKKRSKRGYNGTVTPRYLHMLKETIVPKAVYIELANIRNDWDQRRLVFKSNRQAVANWLCEALLAQ